MSNSTNTDKRSQIMRRAAAVYVVILLVALAVVGKMLFLQLFQRSKYEKYYTTDAIQLRNQYPERADIIDENDNILVSSVPYYDIFFDAGSPALKNSVFDSGIDSLAYYISTTFKKKTKEQIKKELKAERKKKSRYVKIALNVDYRLYTKIKKFPIFRKGKYKGGFIAVQNSERSKPFKELAKKTLGNVRIDELFDQQIGENGLEKYYDDVLKGLPGKMWMQRLPGSVWMPIGDARDIYPEPGKTIVSTIDINLQDFAHRELLETLKKSKAHHGTVIVMEAKTGYIKAMVNLGLRKDSTYGEIYNYAVKEKTAPGSTFKLASYIAGLEDGYFDLNDTVNAGKGSIRYADVVIKDTKEEGYGLITVQQAFELSSNVATSKLIRKHYKQRQAKFIERLIDMGIVNLSGIDLEGEEMPDVNTPDSKLWSGISLEEMSIGYETQFTPMQILTFYNAVANNGTMIKPRLVKQFSKDGKKSSELQPEVIKQAICSEKTLKKVRIMLEGVVERGTADNIRTGTYKIAGKTGTAKYFDFDEKRFIEKYRASFAGYFPADNPKYTCYVLIDKPVGNYYGGIVAAPVFRAIADKLYTIDHDIYMQPAKSENISQLAPVSMNCWRQSLDIVLKELNIKSVTKNKTISDWVNTQAGKNAISVSNKNINKKQIPDVRGMGARDAVWLLESLGLNVKIQGRGCVAKQTLKAGTQIKKNATITLVLEPI